MERTESLRGNISRLRTPCYVIDRGLLQQNLEILDGVQRRAGCKILLALKGFAAWSVFDLVGKYLSGAAASSLFEAQLAREFLPGEVHICGPAYRDDEFKQIMSIVDHIVFNSFSMWERFREQIKKGPREVRCGLRINPRHSEVKTRIYDPCAPGSRLGIPIEQFAGMSIEGITGLHFHTLCELNSDALERTLAAVEQQFGGLLEQVGWVNLGGGHHITRADYDIDLLCRLIEQVKRRYRVEVYLEPGEAIALNTGFLVATVLDIVHNQMDIAILDTSAAAHTPDVLEMPYRPEITGAADPGVLPHTYRLTGMTCLAGDVIGDYSFDKPLKVGDKLVFHDMAHYTMVKNTMFNGINLPDIVTYDLDKDQFTLQRRFEYEDYRKRLS
jgi:carboxynorspermidine decarboxylase